MSPLKLSGVTVRCALLLVSALVATPWAARPAEAQAVTFLQKLLVPGGPGGSRFGAVAVDGTTAVVGASGESARQGAVYVYVRSGNTWTQRQRLVASDGQPFDEFGTDVGLSGNTLIVGAPKAAANAGGQQGQGAAYVFGWNGTAWVQQARLVATDPRASAFFGTHVSIDGNTVVAGAPFFGLPAATGATYVFERSGNTWVGSKLAVPDAGSNDHFGGAVSVSGTTLCVGAPLDTEGVNINQGSVYVYTRGGSGWSLQQKLLAPGGTGDDFFGQSCAIDGDTLVGGADSDDAPLSGQGSAYVFVRAGGTWTFEQQLLASDPGINDQFGFSAAIFGDTVVVGAQGHNNVKGAAYVYGRTGTVWTERQKVQDTNSLAFDVFGAFVSIDAESIFVGAPSCCSLAVSPGAAYVYRHAGAATGAPGAPTNFQASANGNTINMSWGAPSSGAAPTGYTVVARTTGGALLGSAPVGAATSLTVPGAPNGVFVLSALAANGSGPGPESTAVTVTVPNVPAPPGPPTNLTVTVAGDTASFAWGAPASGGPVAGYVLLAGATPGFTVPLGSAALPAAPASLAVPGIPPGTFYARVVAQNGGGASGASNEVAFTVAGPSAPAMPTLNPPVVSGSTVTLSWAPGSGGGAPTSYVLSVTGAVVASAPFSGSSVTVPGVPSGTYFLRLVAVNGVGPSPPSAQVTLVVP